MVTKTRLAFIFHKENFFLNGKHFDNTYYNFFMKALKRNPSLETVYFPTDDIFDFKTIKDDFDAVVLWENSEFGMPKKIINIENNKIPIISRSGDPSRAKKSKILHDKWKINYYFDFFSEKFFHELYPKKFKYKKIFFGLESQLYEKVTPFDERKKDKILNSGNIGNTKFISRIINDLRNPKWNNYRCKVLRTKCCDLDFVDYSLTLSHDYVNDNYVKLLEKYQSAIAADSYTPVQKYWEIPAAGCLTFMEITEKNDGWHTGFKDNENCVIINESNYIQKFKKFLNSQSDPQWRRIAEEGRKFALKNFNNDKAVNELIELVEEIKI